MSLCRIKPSNCYSIIEPQALLVLVLVGEERIREAVAWNPALCMLPVQTMGTRTQEPPEYATFTIRRCETNRQTKIAYDVVDDVDSAKVQPVCSFSREPLSGEVLNSLTKSRSFLYNKPIGIQCFSRESTVYRDKSRSSHCFRNMVDDGGARDTDPGANN